MSLFAQLFQTTGLSIKYDSSMSSFVVRDANQNIKYAGPKDLCSEYIKNFKVSTN